MPDAQGSSRRVLSTRRRMSLADPLWSRSPVVLLRHYPAYAFALVVGAAAFTLTTLSGPTFVDAAEIALLRGQVEAVPATAQPGDRGVVRVALFDSSPELEDAVAARVADLPGARVTTSRQPILYQDSDLQLRPFVASGGRRTTAVLLHTTGATDAVRATQGEPGCPDTDCLWLPDTVAEELGVGAGDRVDVGVQDPRKSDPRTGSVLVTGVYETAATGVPRDPTGLWQRLGDDLPPWPIFADETTPQVPLLLADTATFRRLAEAMGERPLVTWDAVPRAEPTRLDDAQPLVDDAKLLEAEAADRSGDLRAALEEEGRSLTVVSGLPEMVDAARAGTGAVVDGISALRVVGIGFAWLVVLLAVVGLLRRRATERQALMDSGRSGAELTGALLAEVALLVAAGIAVGLWACGPAVEALVGVGGRAPRLSDLVLVVGAIVVTVVAVSLLDHASRARRGARPKVLQLPWRAVLLTVAAAGAVAAYGEGGTGLTPLLSVMPLAAVGAAGIALASALTALLRRVRLPRRMLPRLVVAGLARDPAASGAFLVAAVAFGTLATGLYAASSVDRAVADKVAALAGAETTAGIESEDAESVTEAVPGSTVVWRAGIGIDDRGPRQTLVVDPTTFERAALRSRELAGDLASVLRPRGDDVPVLLVGEPGRWQVGERHVLTRSGWSVDARAVGRVEAFPGLESGDSLLVVPREALFERLGADAPTNPGESPLLPEVWASGSADEVTAAADEAGVFLRNVRSAAEVRATPVLVARSWVTDYLRASTVLALALGVVVLSGLHRQDADRRRLQARTLTDLGHPPRLVGLAAAVRLGVVSLAGAVAGLAASYAATWGLASRLDPLPDLAPRLAVTGLGLTVLLTLGLLVAVLALTLVASRRGRSVNELLQEA